MFLSRAATRTKPSDEVSAATSAREAAEHRFVACSNAVSNDTFEMMARKVKQTAGAHSHIVPVAGRSVVDRSTGAERFRDATAIFIRWLPRAAPLLLTACSGGVLDPHGPVGATEKTILIDSLAIMLSIVLPTIVAIFAFAWWFRSSNLRAKYRPEWEFSGKIELVVWAIPSMVVILLSGVTWIGSYQLDPAKPLTSDKPALEIQVVSLDWKWLFIYPAQGVASVNQLVIPAGRPVHFSLTSASVMNAFFIPQLGSMIYTMNGMTTNLNLQADEPGTFAGLSSHYSGDGFSDMHFETRSVSSSDFDAWIASAHDTGTLLDQERYKTLAQQSIKDPVTLFKAIDPTLFHNIVMLELPPGRGPDSPSADSIPPARMEK